MVDTVPPHLMESWGLGFSPSYTQGRFVDLLLPVVPSPAFLSPQLLYSMVLGWPYWATTAPQALVEAIAAVSVEDQGMQQCSRASSSSALPEQKVSGGLASKSRLEMAAATPLALRGFFSLPLQFSASTCALQEALELIFAIVQRKPRKG